MNLTSHNAPVALRAMQLASVLAIGIGGLLLSGCTTAQPPAPPVPVAAIEAAPAVEPALPAEPVEVATPPVATEPAPLEPGPAPLPTMPETAGRLKIRVESVPAGATIVVNGRPVGHAPVVVEIDSVNNGFFREPVTIRARFIASDAAGESFSVDEELGPRERVPMALVFSRDGAQRVIRRY